MLNNLRLRILKKPLRVYTSSEEKLYDSLRNILGFYPVNIELYKLAFRHSSAAKEIKKGVKNSNERLEFLGDSVVGTIVADYLFKKFPFKDEGFLTKMRSKMVSRAKHNQLALKLGLNKFIEANSGRSNHHPSSINGDAYEALIGAIYLDKGYKATQKFILTRIIHVHIDMDELETKEVDFKSKLIEWVQKEKKKYEFHSTTSGEKNSSNQFTVQLIIDGEVVATAEHSSKKRGEQVVAEQACVSLNL